MAAQCSRSRPLDTPCPCGQHFAVYWLVSSTVSIANRLALAAKLLLQTITRELTLHCATRRGFCEICSLFLSLILLSLVFHSLGSVYQENEFNGGVYSEADRGFER